MSTRDAAGAGANHDRSPVPAASPLLPLLLLEDDR